MLIAARSGPVEVHEAGAGPPLFLLHAAGHDHHDYDAVIPALAARHRVLAVDWPGAHGSRSAPPAAASTELYAGVLDDLVAALAPGGAALVGSSVGGHAALRLAVARPERVRALLLADSGGFVALDAAARLFCRLKGTPWITARIEGAFARRHLRRRTDTVRARLARIEAARRDPGWAAVTASVWRSFLDPAADLRPLAPAVRAPTLVVWGRHDPVLPVAQGRLAARLIPGATLVELDTGHLPFAEDPEGFLAAALPFLDGALRGDAAA
jgi:pimeloyl-ACP methyl ester carboxylesterase